MKRRFAIMMIVIAMAAGIFPARAAEEEKEPVIAGITIERKTTDGFLGIEITGNNFKLTFYDKDKKPVRADFDRALLRWDVIYKKAPERLILTAGGDGTYLTSPRAIRPPYNFQLFITLIADDRDSETYVIRFRQ